MMKVKKEEMHRVCSMYGEKTNSYWLLVRRKGATRKSNVGGE
jgi:hypothetical protein